MSHFAVMVVGENVEEQMSKYDENKQMEPYPAYTLESATKKRQERIDEYTKMVEENNTERYNVAYCKELLEKTSKMTPEEYFKDLCASYDKFDNDGNPLTTYNPNSKWDYYVEGGRLDGFLTLKNGQKSNSALKKDIDFDGMIAEHIDACEKAWDDGALEYPDNDDRSNTKRYWKYGVSVDQWANGKEKYMDEAKKNAKDSFVTFAFVKNGEWCEKGKMGWWACVSNEKMDWKDQFHKLLDSVGEDELITVVDCHI